jgi:hypothetical protein
MTRNEKIMENMKKSQERALKVFIGNIGEITARLSELQEFVNNHMNFAPDEITWAHVGNTSYYLEQLTELTDCAYNRGEFAKGEKK